MSGCSKTTDVQDCQSEESGRLIVEEEKERPIKKESVIEEPKITTQRHIWSKHTRDARFSEHLKLTTPNVGLEIEIPQWHAHKLNGDRHTGTHDIIVERLGTGFELQAELSGRLEFVMKEPASGIPTVDQVIQNMGAMAREITDVTGAAMFPASRIDGEAGFQIAREEYITGELAPPTGQFQATIGVHLSAMPDLFANCSSAENFLDDWEKRPIKRWIDRVRKDCVGRFRIGEYRQISPEMEGLLTLVFYYLTLGDLCSDCPFPKGLTRIMARTDFAQLFSMMPESGDLDAQAWVDLVLNASELSAEERMWKQRFGHRQVNTSNVYEDGPVIELTRGKWLMGMANGHDYLTKSGGGGDIVKSMGELGNKTDELGQSGLLNRGAIVELRNMQGNYKLDRWKPLVEKICNFVAQLNKKMTPQDRVDACAEIDALRQANNPSEEAELCLRKLIDEADRTLFQSQALGLVDRAEERLRSNG